MTERGVHLLTEANTITELGRVDQQKKSITNHSFTHSVYKMAPGTPASSRPPSRATTAQTRVTRLRAAQTASTVDSPAAPASKTGLLARSKEGLRMVGEKMKEKERIVSKGKTVVSAPTTYTESLQVCLSCA
jgi:hypothetical protein